MPKFTKDSFLSESSTATEVTTGDELSAYPVITESRSTTEIVEKRRRPRQLTEKSLVPAVGRVLRSDAVSVRVVGEKRSCAQSASGMQQTATPTSAVGGMRSSTASVAASISRCLMDSAQQTAVVSPVADSSKTTVCGSRMQSSTQCSVALMNNNTRLTSATSSVKSRRIVPTLCRNDGMSSSVTQVPAVTAALKDASFTMESSKSLYGTRLRSSVKHSVAQTNIPAMSIAGAVKSRHIVPTFCRSFGMSSSMPRVPAVTAALKDVSFTMNSCKSASGPRVQSSMHLSVTASTASSVKSRRIVPTLCRNDGMSSSVSQVPAVTAALKDASFTMESGKSACGARVRSSMHHSASPTNNPATSTCGAVKSQHIFSTFSGSDVTSSSLTQEPVVKDEPESSEQLMNRTFTVINSDDESPEYLLSKMSSVSSDGRHNSTYSAITAAPSLPIASAFTRARKSGRRSLVDMELHGKSIVIADLVPPSTSKKQPVRAVPHVSALDRIQQVKKLRQMCGRDSAHLSLTKQVESVHIEMWSAVPRLASGLHHGAATKTDRPGVASVLTVSADGGRQPDAGTGCAGRGHLKSPCFDRPTNKTASKPLLSGVSAAVQLLKSGRQSDCCKYTGAFSGHRAVTVSNLSELSGCEKRRPKAPGFSCCDSIISPTGNERVSDTYLADVQADSGGVEQKSSRRRLRGFATSSRESSPLPDPDTTFCCVSSISLASDQEDYDTAEDTDDDSGSEEDVLLLDTNSSDSAMLQWPNHTNTVELKSQGLSCKNNSSARQECCRSLSRKSLMLQPASSDNVGAFRSHRSLNSRNDVKTGHVSIAVGPTVHPVGAKRTHAEVLSLSSSDSEDETLTKPDSCIQRNTRARLSRRAESIGSHVCDVAKKVHCKC